MFAIMPFYYLRRFKKTLEIEVVLDYAHAMKKSVIELVKNTLKTF